MSRRRPYSGPVESCVLVLVALTVWLGLVWGLASFGWKTNNSAATWLAVLIFVVPIIGVLREKRRK